MLPGTAQVFLGTLELVLGIVRPFLEAFRLLGIASALLGTRLRAAEVMVKSGRRMRRR